jgi:hypothetical protein
MNSFNNIIISNKKEIFRALVESKINNTVIGICASRLGAATYLTGVKEILMQKYEEPIVVLSDHDITGYLLEQRALRLSEITSVIPFISTFQDPALKKYGREETFSKN